MKLVRKIIGALLILAALAAAGWGVWVCAYALRAEPYIEGGEADAAAALDAFLACLARKDFDGAYDLLCDYSSLGLESPPEDALARMYWDAQLACWDFAALEGGEMQGTYMDRRVTVRCLDLDAIAADVGTRVQTLLAEKVADARLRSEVYDESGAYREDVAYDALRAATADVLSDTSKYAYTQECPLRLRYIGGRWLVETSPAFLSALTGGALRG